MQPPTEPAPYLQRHSAGRVTVYLNPECAADVDVQALVELPSALAGLPGRSTRQGGRATAWELPGPPALVVRLYAHGGALGGLMGTWFLDAGRMLEEFRVHLHALRVGVPTSEPVALRLERRWPLVQAHYVTRRVADAVDLADLVGQRPPSAAQRRRLAGAVADAVARMHDAGILHSDLNLRNVLVRDPSGACQALVIDFDKARLLTELTLHKRLANLYRLDRSAQKRAATRASVGMLDRLRVLRAYLDRYPDWRELEGEIARTYRGVPLRHRLSRASLT